MSLFHHSRAADFRCPSGAQPCGTRVRLAVRSDAAQVVLRLWLHGKEKKLPMTEDGGEFFCTLTLPQDPCVVWYGFLADGVWYGPARGTCGEAVAHAPGSFQITVYRQDYATPRWFGESVVYQIFTDRFYNPLPQPLPLPRGSRYHKDWYEMPEWQAQPGAAEYLPEDFFGGNLWGVAEKLPYLRSLGVGCIYLNPIFEAPSNHKYDTADYEKVDDGFGGDAALQHLIRRAKGYGIRVILDGVFSHTGADSRYFNKKQNYPETGAWQGEGSPYYSWYTFSPTEKWGYACWWDVPSLPELNELDPACLDYLVRGEDAIAKRWVRFGTGGWRLDVADELPDNFLFALRKAVKSVDENAVLIGEVWEDASRKEGPEGLRPYLLGEQLDGVMNYPLRRLLLDLMMGKADAAQTAEDISALQESYPLPAFYCLMNLMGSHDRPRVLSALAGAPEPEGMTREEMVAWQYSEAQLCAAKGKLKLMSLLLYALPGAPTLYYGDETGMTGLGDPFCRGTYPWGREDTELVEWFRWIGQTRMDNPCLLRGNCAVEARDDVLYITRSVGERDVWGQPAHPQTVVCMVNMGRQAVPLPQGQRLVCSGEEAENLQPGAGCWIKTGY